MTNRIEEDQGREKMSRWLQKEQHKQRSIYQRAGYSQCPEGNTAGAGWNGKGMVGKEELREVGKCQVMGGFLSYLRGLEFILSTMERN